MINYARFLIFIFLILTLPYTHAEAIPAFCSHLESHQNVKITEAGNNTKIMGKKILEHFSNGKNNNIGSTIIKFPIGDKIIFRSSILAESPMCLNQLIKQFHVKTIVNLYSNQAIENSELIKKEQQLFNDNGGEMYINILNFDYHFRSAAELEKVHHHIAHIINLIQHAPGNVEMHCLGGMHRTGIIYGVMQKCYNHTELSEIIKQYKIHTNWKSEEDKGLYRSSNIEVIKKFPCKLLH